MGLYDFLSTGLTGIGYCILVYRIVHELQGKNKKGRLQRLLTKWLIFTIFLKLQYYLLALVELLPFGRLLLLVFKLFLFLPDNAISHSIYKRIHKVLQRIQLEEYHSVWAAAISIFFSLFLSVLLRAAAKIAAYTDSRNIDSAERLILEIIKVLEYKKTAISMRHQAPASDVNKDLNSSDFSNSIIEQQPHSKKIKRSSSIAYKMNRILSNSRSQKGQDQPISLKAKLMVNKPDKQTGSKAVYSQVELQYYCENSRMIVTQKNEPYQQSTLKEVRWITKNMLNVELVCDKGISRIVKIKDSNDVVRWMEPVCANLQRLAEKQQQTQKNQRSMRSSRKSLRKSNDIQRTIISPIKEEEPFQNNPQSRVKI